MPSSKIIEVAPVEKAYMLYEGFHTLDVKEAIRILAERAASSPLPSCVQ